METSLKRPSGKQLTFFSGRFPGMEDRKLQYSSSFPYSSILVPALFLVGSCLFANVLFKTKKICITQHFVIFLYFSRCPPLVHLPSHILPDSPPPPPVPHRFLTLRQGLGYDFGFPVVHSDRYERAPPDSVLWLCIHLRDIIRKSYIGTSQTGACSHR